MKIKEIINELFDSPVDYNIYRILDVITAKFSVDGIEYEVDFSTGLLKRHSYDALPDYVKSKLLNFEYTKINFWKMGATHRRTRPTQDITGTGNEFKVFSTVFKIIKDVLKIYENISVISFEAKEHSRVKLYDRLVTTLLRDSEWQLFDFTHITNSELKEYWLVRK